MLIRNAWNLTLPVFGSKFLNFLELLNSCEHFIRLINLSAAHLKRACEDFIFVFLKINKEFLRAHYQIFIPVRKKCQLYRKFDIFIPGWKLISGYLNRVEILICNWNVILKRSLLFSLHDISTRYIELKF